MSKPIAYVNLVALILLVWSGIQPADYWTWLFEVILGVVGIAVLNITYRRFRFSNLVYVLVSIHFAILVIGAKYTYAEMPLCNWLRDAFDLARNHYDRVGHFAQGFFPAIIIREVLLRVVRIRPGKILALICISLCLAISAFYELIEWWVVLAFYSDQGPAWLGMQGDQWDAQWDMFLATCGATLAVLLLGRIHDRSMAELSL